MRNDYMKMYWRGYRAAKADACECGVAHAASGPVGNVSDAFYKGWRRYTVPAMQRAREFAAQHGGDAR